MNPFYILALIMSIVSTGAQLGQGSAKVFIVVAVITWGVGMITDFWGDR